VLYSFALSQCFDMAHVRVVGDVANTLILLHVLLNGFSYRGLCLVFFAWALLNWTGL